MKNRTRRLLFKTLTPLYFCLIFCGPLAVIVLTFAWMPRWEFQAILVILSPVIYTLLFVLTAGSLSAIHRKAIIAGRFPRELGDPIYFHRRLYGFCWTSVYYFSPVYFAALSMPLLSTPMFRLFGYRGPVSFTTYPDTWIRDIPLLEIGEGAYLSNKATIGTNIVLSDGNILVGKIKIGRNSTIGHLAVIGLGSQVGDNVEVGVGVAIGMKCLLGDGVKAGSCCGIEHGVEIGAGVKIGAMAYIGTGSWIAPGLVIPAGITIPPKTKLTCQEEVKLYSDHLATIESKLRRLRTHRPPHEVANSPAQIFG